MHEGKADIVIGGMPEKSRDLTHLPLFKFEIMAVLPPEHTLRNKSRLFAEDFSGETLISYPVPDARIDLIRQVLTPAHITYQRRTAELTIAIMQLVASRRGIAALPSWGIQSYVNHEYVIAKPIGKTGLWSELYSTGEQETMGRAYAVDLVRIIRECCSGSLKGIKLF